jgi:gamma-glutamyltranspeptidase/glutathione hydrolase
MRPRLLLPAIALSLALFPPSITAQEDTTGNRRSGRRPVVAGRSMVITRLGIVATSHPLASSAGAQILEQGGNAVDAAIAANATLGLTEPMMNGVGGDLFAIIYIASEGKLYGLNSAGWASTGLTPQLLASRQVTRLTGAYSVTVPGAVAGWHTLRERFGKLPFSTILKPAMYHAENGFPVSEVVAGGWGRGFQTPAARETYLIDGQPPEMGQVFKNPDYARTLARIAERGRDGFYTGPVADAILAAVNEGGNPMTRADLAEFQPEWVTPIQTTYRGWTVYELGAPTQGVAALMMLNLMEQYPLAEWGFQSTRTMHAMIEAKKLAYADMLRYTGDPRVSAIPMAQMLSKPRAVERAKLIDPAKAACEVQPAQLAGVTDSEGNETIYLSVIDKDGNIVSLIESIYSSWGSRLVPRGGGFALHNRGGLFTLAPGHPNTLAPRKRPLHTLIPGFMEKDGVRIGFGIMGGWNQSQAHAQFVSNIADFGMNIQEALEAGRFTKGSFEGCDVTVEHLVADSVRTQLGALGHRVTTPRPRSGTFGWGQAVMSDPRGVHYGASEPRHDGAAIPEPPPIFVRPPSR